MNPDVAFFTRARLHHALLFLRQCALWTFLQGRSSFGQHGCYHLAVAQSMIYGCRSAHSRSTCSFFHMINVVGVAEEKHSTDLPGSKLVRNLVELV